MGSNSSLLFAMGLMIIVYYFLLIRPQQQRVKRHKAMVEALKKGDVVVTQGGIKGKVAQVKADDTFISIEIAKGTNVEVLKSTIQNVVNPTTPAKAANQAKK